MRTSGTECVVQTGRKILPDSSMQLPFRQNVRVCFASLAMTELCVKADILPAKYLTAKLRWERVVHRRLGGGESHLFTFVIASGAKQSLPLCRNERCPVLIAESSE